MKPAAEINLHKAIILVAIAVIATLGYYIYYNNLFFIVPAVLLFTTVVLPLKNRLQISKQKKEIQQINEQLRELTAHLQQVREEERMIIAREIHDELGQQLTGLKMDVFWLNKKLQPIDEIIQGKIAGMLQLIDEAIKSVRRISTNLRPDVLDDLGLVAALEWQSLEEEKRSEVKVMFFADSQSLPTDIPPNIATSIFRIYQEALAQAVRHANAHVISGTLRWDNNCLVLTINDDGNGIDTGIKNSEKTLGLPGIKERTLMLGGKYTIANKPGRGTLISISIPL
jgi:signal transduction histidine kinase